MANELSTDEKLVVLATEFAASRTRFWCFLIPGLIVWPLLLVATVEFCRMREIKLMGRLYGETGDDWLKIPEASGAELGS
jgi:hypothetical protein